MFCESCGSEIAEGSKFCVNCGSSTGAEAAVEAAVAPHARSTQHFCQFCGSKIAEDSKFCESCGKNTETGDAAESVQAPNAQTVTKGSSKKKASSNASAPHSSKKAASNASAPHNNKNVAVATSASRPNKSGKQPALLIFGLTISLAVILLIVLFILIALNSSEDDESANSKEGPSNPTEEVAKEAPKENNHTVVIETDGGTTYDQFEALDGKTINIATIPEKAGYTFAGWYTDKDWQNSFEFPHTVSSTDPETIIIYAKWDKNAPAVQNTAPTTQPNDSIDSGLMYNANAPFWGAWIGAFRIESNAINYRDRAIAAGFNAEIVISTQWRNLNQSERLYCITVCRATSQEVAQSYALQARNAGFDNAYASYSGDFIRY